MFQGYVGFVLENYLRPECPIQDMDRLKPESLQQTKGTNLSKVRSEKKKVTSFKTMYIIELQQKMSFFRENPYIGHTCAILFLQSRGCNLQFQKVTGLVASMSIATTRAR